MSNQTALINYRSQLEKEEMPAGKKKTLLAAIELFSTYGFNGTSTAQLADLAQVSQATIFKYFKTKQDILLAVLQPLLLSIKDEFWQEIYQIKDLEQVIAFAVKNRMSFLEENLDLFKILLQEYMVNPQLQAFIRENLGSWQAEFDLYIKELRVENPSLNPHLSAFDIMSIIAGPIIAHFLRNSLTGQKNKPDFKQIQSQILLILCCHESN